jgi:K+-transporting ATPase ATPase A chain
MPSDGFIFAVMLTGTALLLGALNFLPALSLGPIAEHFSIHSQTMGEMLLAPISFDCKS